MLLDRARVVTPVCRTDAGKVGSAIAARFCTLTWLMLRLLDWIKLGRNGTGAVVATGGCDILHPFHPVDLPLNHSGDGIFNGLGIGTDRNAGGLNLRRGNIWQVVDGQQGNADDANQQDQEGANR